MEIRLSVYTVLILSFSFLMNACKSDDDIILCFTPPGAVVFEFIDSDGVNLIENGVLKTSEIKIKDITNPDNPKNSTFTLREDYKIIINEAGWFNGTKDFSFESPAVDFEFTVISHELTGNCGGYKIDDIIFHGITYTLGEYDVYRFIIN